MLRSAPRFETVRALGEGATARVSLVRLTAPFRGRETGTLFALKELREELADDKRARRALRREGELSRRFEVSTLAHCVYAGKRDELPFLLFEYVDGRDLGEVLEEGALPEPQVRAIGEQLATALAALHAGGVAHGDVKPENVRLAPDGRAVLLDLGFAARLSEGFDPGTAFAGTLAYLSPERARGGPPDAASDLYALGVLLYELATGVHPHGAHRRQNGPSLVSGSSSELLRRSVEEPDADQLLATILRGRILPPSRLVPGLSPFLDALLLDLMLVRAGERPGAAVVQERFSETEASTWWRSRVAGDMARQRAPRLGSGGHIAPLVGRGDELATLGRLVQEITEAGKREEPSSHVVWLSGPTGSGKWRLVHEFAARARMSLAPPLYLYARWSEAAGSRPGGALLLLLHRWLQLPLGTAPDERARELLRELVAPAQERALSEALASNAGEARESVSVALAAWLSALARQTPCVVFLDDLHRAGHVTMGALASVIDRLSTTNVLLILGAREDVEAEASQQLERLREAVQQKAREEGKLELHELRLGPLEEPAIGELVDELFHRTTPKLRLTRVLWERSRGNPGLLNEILRGLVSGGQATPHPDGDGRFALTVRPDDIPLPRSLDGLIAERFRTLDPGDRIWVERLAVIGGRITAEFVSDTFGPVERAEVDAVLARLVRGGWLVPRGDRYRFSRPALREAIYRSIGELRRRLLHRTAADGLSGGGNTMEERFQRAFHLRAARDHEGLIELGMPLMRDLRNRAAPQRTFTLTRWILEAFEANPPKGENFDDLLEVFEVATDAADRLGKRDEERLLLDRLARLEERGLAPEHGARVYLLHGRYAIGTGQFGLARGMLRNASLLAEEALDQRLLSEAQRRLALVQAQIGDLEEAERLVEMARESATDGGQRTLAELAAAVLDLLSDRLEPALRSVERALQELERLPGAPLGVIAHANLLRARAWRSAGRPARSMAAARRAVRLAHRAGERRLEAEARARLGGYLADLDRIEQAEAYLRDALFTAKEIEDRRSQTLGDLFLGALLWDNDDPAARSSIESGLELARSIGYFRAEAVGHSLLARVEREAGHTKAAEACCERALALLDRYGAELADRILIVATYALVHSRRRRHARSAEVLSKLHERIDAANRAIEDNELRLAQRAHCERLLAAVLSPDGPVFPRQPLADREESRDELPGPAHDAS